jgi:hypothetical protein
MILTHSARYSRTTTQCVYFELFDVFDLIGKLSGLDRNNSKSISLVQMAQAGSPERKIFKVPREV